MKHKGKRILRKAILAIQLGLNQTYAPTEVFESYSQLSKGAGSHAEVLAVNNALKTNPNARIEDLNVNVIRTGVNKKKAGGLMFKCCCPHCTHLLDGFEVISEVHKVER